MTDNRNAIAAAFVAARRDRRVLPAYPGQAPEDLAGAYAIQDRALAIDGRAIAGWKVGRINPPLDAVLGSNRVAGPIFADTVVTAQAGEVPEVPIFAGGFAAIESEFVLHLAAGWNGVVPHDDAGTRALLDAVRIGVEIAGSPYPGINADGPLVTISDFGNNQGLVLGPLLADGPALDFDGVTVRSHVDGETVGEATTATLLDGPLGAVRFLLGNLAARGIDCSAGTWISTGAVTGVHAVRTGQRVLAVFDGLGSVECALVP